MKRLTQQCRKLGVLGGMILWLGSSGLSYASHFPAENVSATKHNLAANTNIGFGSTTLGSSEVCVFCHTPHGAGYATGGLLATGIPPLWNRKLNITASYTTYDTAPGSPSFDSAATLGGAIKGVSLACLSCHDGTIAFDALINLPGSGGYQPANATAGAGPGDTSTSNALFGPFSGVFVAGDRSFVETPRTSMGAGPGGSPFGGSVFTNNTLVGQLGATPFPNLGTDLTDDHPISFQIPAGSVDPQFSELELGILKDATKNLVYLKRRLNGTSTGILPQDSRDRIRAYPSTGLAVSTASVTNAYIECASCHNPHTPRTLFLRLPSNVDSTGAFNAIPGLGLSSGGAEIANVGASSTYWSHAPNQGSAICLSCHQK